ncbi:class I SAM-dependent methyltransferase [Chryseobacterium sp. 2TAF14]|uniref:class I SAM-dependent methyltransferase n=1 Tax=Chryseobacterium sp. 2TAF14 TaxID=3233007 RepID=UPI003F929267
MNNIYEPKFVKQLFNQMSGSYERMNYITSFGFSIRWRKQFLSKLGKSNENLNVIDRLKTFNEAQLGILAKEILQNALDLY